MEISLHNIVCLQFQEDAFQGRIALDFVHRAGNDQLALFDDGNTVAEFFGNFQNVGGEENCATVFAMLTHDEL